MLFSRVIIMNVNTAGVNVSVKVTGFILKYLRQQLSSYYLKPLVQEKGLDLPVRKIVNCIYLPFYQSYVCSVVTSKEA